MNIESLHKKFQLTFGYYQIIEVAIQNIDDQEILTKIILGTDYEWAQQMAIKNLTDQKFISKVVNKPLINEVKKEAVKKLNNQEILSKIALHNKYKQTRLLAVKNLNKQSVLKRIAHKDPSKKVRKAATNKITDENILSKIALNDKSKTVQKEALKNITNQNDLLEIIFKSNQSNLVLAATKKLNNQKHLKKVVQKSNHFKSKLIALEKINDKSFTQDKIENIAQNDPNSINLLMLDQIDDQSILAYIALHNTDKKISRTAFEKIDDKNILKNVANNAKSHNQKIGILAVKKIENIDYLEKIALEANYFDIRKKAIDKIDRQASLIEIIKSVNDIQLMTLAINKTSDESFLEYLALHHRHHKIRGTATSQLSNLKTLQEIAKNDNHKLVQQCAHKRINYLKHHTPANEIEKEDSSQIYNPEIATNNFEDSGNNEIEIWRFYNGYSNNAVLSRKQVLEEQRKSKNKSNKKKDKEHQKFSSSEFVNPDIDSDKFSENSDDEITI